MFKILGIDDSVNACECCGKTGLKSTVVVEVNGEIKHYGSVCATHHTGKDSTTINREVKAAALERLDAAMREFKATPEYMAREAVIAAAHRAGVAPGKTFREATREAVDAANAKSVEIAAKFGVNLRI